MLHRRKLHYQTPPLCKGAHEGRVQCADTEHRAVMREAEGRLGPGNLEPKAAKRLECRAHGVKRSAQTRNTGPPKARPVRRRKYAGPYPRAAKGEGAGEAGEHGANPEAAKRLEPRGHGAKRSPQGRNTAPP